MTAIIDYVAWMGLDWSPFFPLALDLGRGESHPTGSGMVCPFGDETLALHKRRRMLLCMEVMCVMLLSFSHSRQSKFVQ